MKKCILCVVVTIFLAFGINVSVGASTNTNFDCCPECGSSMYYRDDFEPEACTSPGYSVYNCMGCGYYEKIIIPAGGHSLCSYENASMRYQPTCTEDGFKGGLVCTKCNIQVEKPSTIPALGHILTVTEEGKEPTCTQSGYTPSVKCEREGCHYKTKQEHLPAKGHTIVIDEKVEPDCEKTGLTEGNHCFECGKVLVAQGVISALGHQYDEGVTQNPSCSEYGCQVYTCKVCKHTKSTTIAKLPHKYGDYIIDVKPTCASKGKKSKYCIHCNNRAYIENIPALEHIETIDNEVLPTCSETGLTEGSHCSVCNEILIKQKEVPVKHTKSESWVVVKKATCVDEGMNVLTCEDCNIVLKAQAIKSTGEHTAKTTGKKSATYFAKGYTGKTVCKDCGEVFSKGKTIAKLKLKTPKVTIKGSKKKLAVKYKIVKDSTGFQVKYKIGKKTVTKTYNTKKTITKTIKNLKKGTYKVYVRAFIKKGTDKAYSSWTKPKTIKVK